MRGVRSEVVNDAAAGALKIIRYFDALVECRVSAEALVGATAAMAEIDCGLETDDGRMWLLGPDGAAVQSGRSSGSTHAFFEVDGTKAHMWLERPDGAAPTDDLIIERASLAARILLMGNQRRTVGGLADPALVETVLSSRESAADRCRALRRLGLAPDLPLRVVAVSVEDGRDPAAEAVALVARGRPMRSVYVAVISGVAAVLFQRGAPTESPATDMRSVLRERTREQRSCAGLRIAVGSSVGPPAAATSWAQALMALRFALPPGTSGYVGDPGDAVVDYDALGALALLADVPDERLRSQPDVVALNTIAATASGAMDIAALEAFFRMGSLRQAAQSLYLHHSTVAARLARVEDAMGWHLDDPVDRFRAQFTVWARRLAQTLHE